MTEFFSLILQSFVWPLARSASPDESIIVELRTQTTKILLRTGLATTSTSRGTISSNSKIVGRYIMLMQGKVERPSSLLLAEKSVHNNL